MPEYEICLWDDDIEDRICDRPKLVEKMNNLEEQIKKLSEERRMFRSAFMNLGIYIVKQDCPQKTCPVGCGREVMVNEFLRMKEAMGDDGEREFKWISTKDQLPPDGGEMVLVCYPLDLIDESAGLILAFEILEEPKKYPYWAPLPRPMKD